MSAPRLALAALLLCLAAVQAAVAQPPDDGGQEVTLVVEEGTAAQERLAFPALDRRPPMTADAVAAADELESALRGDLVRSGIFLVQGPEELEILELTGEQARDFELYRSLGNRIVLLGEIYQEEDRLVLEARVWDLASGQTILGKRYRGGWDLARRIAHAFSDEIVYFFSGRKGIALTTLAFTSDRSGDKEIYLMDYDGHNQRPITGHTSISMSPDWSPRGDAIAYLSYFKGYPGLYLVDLATGAKQPMVTDGTLNSSPSFSSDGSKVAFARSLAGNTEIFVANRDGSSLERLTNSAGIDTNPAWSPSGRQIAFTSSRAGNPHIYVVDVEGTNLRRVTFEGDYNDGASWSPDGSRIAYATRRGGNDFKIAVTDLALLDTRVLTDWSGSHESPSYSPDGKRIAFSSRSRGETQIYVMDVAGANVEQLTSAGNNTGPDWSGYTE